MILVVGDAMLDIYDHVESVRDAPESPGSPVVTHQSMRFMPGGCLNVAKCIMALGEEVQVISTCGLDPTSQSLMEECKDIDVLWNASDGETTCKTRVMLGKQMLMRYDIDRAPEPDEILDEIDTEVISVLDTGLVECLVLSDYGKGVLARPQKIIQHARDLKIPIIVDPKGKDWSRYDGASVIKPNKHEVPVTDFQIIASVLVTKGAEGMTLYDPAHGFKDIKGIPRDAVDPTGAGDQVIAALAVFWAVKGATLAHAAAIANVIAGLGTEYEGVRPITLQETLDECRKFRIAVPV
jgi:D-beta-D-heptose 7-phosphate kinase/D-beta-D-heptose 1-phosphate adenosyltransferase